MLGTKFSHFLICRFFRPELATSELFPHDAIAVSRPELRIGRVRLSGWLAITHMEKFKNMKATPFNFIAVYCLVLLAGCATRSEIVGAPAQPPAPNVSAPPPSVAAPTTMAPNLAPAAIPRPSPAYTVVRTYFATDRNLTDSSKPDKMFGTSRSVLSYGTCDVSIPGKHKKGELESPSIWRLEFREDQNKHVVLLSTAVSDKEKFFAEVAARANASPKSNAFLFVHGYNVTFADAAKRTAQISHDLGFEGAPVFYSWPSQGSVPGYTIDEQNIEWSQANMLTFLEDFFARSEARNVYLIAHSMGNRGLTRAVGALMAKRPDLRDRLKEVILAAPDIDAEVFKRDIAPALAAAGRPITLYASADDLALAASRKVHQYPRAGDTKGGPVLVPGIETIDATGMDTALLGHSYIAESNSVLADLHDLVRNNLRADQRSSLGAVETPAGRYWTFKRNRANQ